MTDKRESEHKATKTVHWPSGPVNCCDKHAHELTFMAKFLGSHVGVTLAPDDAVCSNCVNEAREGGEGV